MRTVCFMNSPLGINMEENFSSSAVLSENLNQIYNIKKLIKRKIIVKLEFDVFNR